MSDLSAWINTDVLKGLCRDSPSVFPPKYSLKADLNKVHVFFLIMINLLRIFLHLWAAKFYKRLIEAYK